MAIPEAYVYELLPVYYDKVFPFEDLYTWLQGNTKNKDPAKAENDLHQNASYREIAFQLPPEVYIRFLSYRSAEEWKKSVKKSKPDRMEIGPVYSHEPKDKDSVSKDRFVPQRKELVFDLDMDDFDPVRTCCSGAKVCKHCFIFLKLGMLILDKILREDFGFKQLMFVYSGRRGVHCWVSDAKAAGMNNDMRGAVVEYFNLFNANIAGTLACKLEKQRCDSLHPVIFYARNIIEPYVRNEILKNQKCLNPSTAPNTSPMDGNPHLKIIHQTLHDSGKQDLVKKYDELLLKLQKDLRANRIDNAGTEIYNFCREISENEDASLYRNVATSNSDASSMGSDASIMGGGLLGVGDAPSRVSTNGGRKSKVVPLPKDTVLASKRRTSFPPQINANLAHLAMETCFRLGYPRFDVNVTKQMNHLAKCPFCIHPKSGKICVPIMDIKSFDHEKVPTLGSLITEMNQYQGDVAKTSMQPYLTWFKSYVSKMDASKFKTQKTIVKMQKKDNGVTKMEI